MGKREILEVLFSDGEHARRAITALTGVGFGQEDLGSLGPSEAPQLRSATGGVVLGSLVGALVGCGIAAAVALGSGVGLPVGFVVAAGVATGAVAGIAAATLLRSEMADEDRYITEEVEAGRTRMKVWVTADREVEVMSLLRAHGAVEAGRLGTASTRRVYRPRIVGGSDLPGSRAA
jgi:hypothetical protein